MGDNLLQCSARRARQRGDLARRAVCGHALRPLDPAPL